MPPLTRHDLQLASACSGANLHLQLQDKVIKVWDIRNFRCLQTFTDKTVYHPEDVLGAVVFDNARSQMISANTSLSRWPIEVLRGSGIHGHASPAIQVLYNSIFEDAISGDHEGTVCVWNIKTGRLRFRSVSHIHCQLSSTQPTLQYGKPGAEQVHAWLPADLLVCTGSPILMGTTP